MISEASILTAEAETSAAVFFRLAAEYRSKPGEACRAIGANLAVMAADFQAEAQRTAQSEASDAVRASIFETMQPNGVG